MRALWVVVLVVCLAATIVFGCLADFGGADLVQRAEYTKGSLAAVMLAVAAFFGWLSEGGLNNLK